MANTNTPQFQTYKPLNVVFSETAAYRSGNITTRRDPSILNMYFDYSSNRDKQTPTRLKKRPGLVTTEYSLSKAVSTDNIRGSFYDEEQNAFYWAVGDKLYSVKPDVGTTVRTVATLNTSSGYVGFCQYLKSDNTRYVVASDGTDLWLDNYAVPSAARVTDVDLPTPHIPYPVYIDGYIVLADASSGDIYNSVVDDPTSWVAGDFITAEMSADTIRALARMKNHVLVFGYDSIEYFYNAGIATGSPFQRNDSPFQQIGYITGLCKIGNVILFVGHQKNQNIGVYAITDFTVRKVSDDTVDRTIQAYSTTINGKSQVNLSTDSFSIAVDGHYFYVLVTGTTTWVYDIDHKEWYEWRDSSGNPLKIEAAWQMFNGNSYVALDDATVISMFSPEAYQDSGSNFTCQYITERIDAGTKNWKFASRMVIDCSQEATTGTSNLGVAWSDNDWKDAGTTARNINVFSVSPMMHRLGKFRTRSFKFTYTDNYPFWVNGFVLDINVGRN